MKIAELLDDFNPDWYFDVPETGPGPDARVTGDVTDVGELSAWPHELYKVLRWTSASDLGEASEDAKVASVDRADIIASRVAGSDKHTIMVDLDVPARLVPSTTPGHSHLYVDVPTTWHAVCGLLDALVAAGVVEHGYAEASKARGYTALRLPWVRKEVDGECRP